MHDEPNWAMAKSFLNTRWQDVAVPLRPGVPEWPGDTPFGCRWTMRRQQGDSVNLSAISGSPHVGTHADAPLHVEDGWAATEVLPLAAFAGEARVVQVPAEMDTVELHHLMLDDTSVQRLLLRTNCSVAEGRFPDRWPAISEECARALVAMGLCLLGTDAPSVDSRSSKELRVHRILFTGGAAVVENLDLRTVRPGTYTFWALPMRLEGLDAAPVRALLSAEPLP